MGMMKENEEGNMEFPRDIMVEDCFSGVEEPLYGFVTNITIPEAMLKPCLIGVECFENGTRFDEMTSNNSVANDIMNDTESISRTYSMSFILYS